MQILVLLGLRAQESLLSTVRAEQLQLVHPGECANVSIQYNSHYQELLLVGKIGISPELYDADAPTFHVHRSRIAELVREFKAAHGLKNADPNVKYNDKPREKRLNSRLENDNLADEAFERLSERT